MKADSTRLTVPEGEQDTKHTHAESALFPDTYSKFRTWIQTVTVANTNRARTSANLELTSVLISVNIYHSKLLTTVLWLEGEMLSTKSRIMIQILHTESEQSSRTEKQTNRYLVVLLFPSRSLWESLLSATVLRQMHSIGCDHFILLCAFKQFLIPWGTWAATSRLRRIYLHFQ